MRLSTSSRTSSRLSKLQEEDVAAHKEEATMEEGATEVEVRAGVVVVEAGGAAAELWVSKIEKHTLRRSIACHYNSDQGIVSRLVRSK